MKKICFVTDIPTRNNTIFYKVQNLERLGETVKAVVIEYALIYFEKD